MENKKIKIAVAGTGYVGLSIATLLSQHHEVVAVDVVPEKVELINSRRSPIQDEYIEKYLAEKELNLKATTDGALRERFLVDHHRRRRKYCPGIAKPGIGTKLFVGERQIGRAHV